MNITFSPQAWEDYIHWQSTDNKMVKRIHSLIKEVTRTPFEGAGKPEPLKHAYAGFWSRRIDSEHRMVYKVTETGVLLAQLRLHYTR
jgi:toxin YoeB